MANLGGRSSKNDEKAQKPSKELEKSDPVVPDLGLTF